MLQLLLLLLLLLLRQAAIIINIRSCHNYHRHLYLVKLKTRMTHIQHRTMFSGYGAGQLCSSTKLHCITPKVAMAYHISVFTNNCSAQYRQGFWDKSWKDTYKCLNTTKNSKCSSKYRGKVCPAIGNAWRNFRQLPTASSSSWTVNVFHRYAINNHNADTNLLQQSK